MDRLVSQQVGEYVLEAEIGGGVSGVVYRAYQPTVNRQVALKLIHLPTEAMDGELVAFERRFTQEAQVLASLEHPHIVPIYHYGIVKDEWAYIAMRMMRETLREQLLAGPMPPERVTDILLQLLDGLGYAHRRGIIHRDIKPQNILFDEAGSACLADFGLARVADRTLNVGEIDTVRAGAVYLSPEQIRSTSMDHRCDIYSLGAIMYEMLTGRAPFEIDDTGVMSLLKRIEREEPIPPRKLNPNVPPELERVVMQALNKEPRERFFDVQEMMAALELVPGTRLRNRIVPLNGGRPAIQARIQPPARRRNQIIAACAVLVVILTGLIVITNAIQANTPLRTPTILQSTLGTPGDLIPSAEEVSQAQRLLGSSGSIAYIACRLDSQFETVRAQEMSARAAEHGMKFQVYDGQGDAYRQLTLIEQARMDGAKAVVLCPLKPNALSSSLDSLHSGGIPTVLTDSIDGGSNSVTLDQDNRQIGALAGEYIVSVLRSRAVSQPNVLVLAQPDYSFSAARVQGFTDALRLAFPDANLVLSDTGGTDQTASEATVRDTLDSGQSIDAIFSITDQGAYGAINALNDAQVAPESVAIASVNAESLALTDIYNENYLLATVDVARLEGSRGVVDAAVKLLGGGTLPAMFTVSPEMLITREVIAQESTSEQ